MGTTPPPPPPPPTAPPPASNGDITDNDKLMALLGYILAPIVPIIVLATDGKNRPFQRYHNVQGLILSIAWLVIYIVTFICLTIITTVTLGIGGLLFFCWFILPVVQIVQIVWYGIKAYQGQNVEIPWITNFAKGQGWL